MSRIFFQKSYIAIFPSYKKNDTHKHPFLHLFFGKNGCNIIIDGKEIEGNIPEDSALSVKLVNTLIESADKNGEFVPFVVE